MPGGSFLQVNAAAKPYLMWQLTWHNEFNGDEMARCYSEMLILSPPECSQTFAAEAWLIIDTVEQPGLAAHIRRDGFIKN